MDITLVECSGIIVVSLEGETGEFSGARFKEILKEKSSNAFECGIIDLSRLACVTDSMVIAFLSLARQVALQGGVLVFVGLEPFSHKLCGEVGLTNMLPIFSSHEKAMDYCRGVMNERDTAKYVAENLSLVDQIERFLSSQEEK